MNVVMLNDYAFSNGGASQVAMMELLGLAQAGVPVVLFSAVGPADPRLEKVGVRVVLTGQGEALSSPNKWAGFRQGLWNRKSADALRELLGGFDPASTVVHLHGWTKALSASVLPAVREAGFKTVLSLHDYFSACPNGGFFHFPSQTICTKKALSLSCALSNCDSRNYGFKLYRLLRQGVAVQWGGMPAEVDGFFCVSEFSHKILEPYLPAGRPLCRLSNPVDAPHGPEADPGRNKVFTAVGRLSPEKGLRVLADASRRIGAETVYVGDGPQREILSSEPRSTVTGWLGRDEVWERIRKSRALVFASLLYETQGLAVAEAASQGIPVIVSDGGAAREWVENGVTGLWFKNGDAGDLAIQMARLRDDGEEAARMGREAYRRFWAQPPTLEGHVEALLEGYRRILSGGAS
jgi:glycosyltransferase involved in cell wall biosynthesis